MKDQLEIERKFLIKMPKREDLLAQKECSCDEIEQTYIKSENGVSARVRCRRNSDACRYTKTEKIRLTDTTCIEKESEISREQYDELLKTRLPELITIEKTRYSFPYDEKTVEIDIYPFWQDVAVLEIELEREDEALTIPEFISVVCELTKHPQFKNRAMAKRIPDVTQFLSKENI